MKKLILEISESEKRRILKMHESAIISDRGTLFEQETQLPTTNAIVYASTSPENMPNSENMEKHGLQILDMYKKNYPIEGIENYVFASSISNLVGKNNLNHFVPIRKTTKPMDVLKYGDQGGDFAVGGQATIEFTDTSSGQIEASHNGLLAIARAMDVYTNNGRPKPAKFIIKIGQPKRYGNILEYGDLDVLNISKKPGLISYQSWPQYMAMVLVPADKMNNNTPVSRAILAEGGKTIEERIKYLQNINGKGLRLLQKIMAKNDIPDVKVDLASYVRNNYGKDLNDPKLVAAFNEMWPIYLNHYFTTINNHFSTWKNMTGIEVPGLEKLLTDIKTMSQPAQTPFKAAEPILVSTMKGTAPIAGQSPNVTGSAGEYKIGQARN